MCIGDHTHSHESIVPFTVNRRSVREDEVESDGLVHIGNKNSLKAFAQSRAGIEQVAQSIAYQIERQHAQGQCHGGEEDQVR